MKFDLLKLDLTKLDLAKLDFTKIDFSRLNVNSVKTINAFFLMVISIILVLALILFFPFIKDIHQAEEQKKITTLNAQFINDLISKKDKFITAQILSQDKIDSLIEKIYSLAEKNKIEASINNNIINDTQPTDGSYVRKVITMNASGSFKNLGTFLSALRNMKDAILDIKYISISRNVNDFSMVQAQVDLVLLTTKDDENK